MDGNGRVGTGLGAPQHPVPTATHVSGILPPPYLPLLQARRSPSPSPLCGPNPTSPRSGKQAFGKGWLALPGWPPWLRTSALRSCARSWTTCGLTLITWGCSSRTRESVEGEGRGGGARGVGDAHHSHSSGLTPTPCTGSMRPGSPERSCRWRTPTSTVPTAPRATPR